MQVIDDPDFMTFGRRDSRWEIEAHHGIVMTGQPDDSVMCLQISNAKGANWHGEFRFAPFSVHEGQLATIRFSARAQTPIDFSVWIGMYHSPWSQLVSNATHFKEKHMTDQWTSFEHQSVIVQNEEQARLNFVLGVVDNQIWLKDISFTLEI